MINGIFVYRPSSTEPPTTIMDTDMEMTSTATRATIMVIMPAPGWMLTQAMSWGWWAQPWTTTRRWMTRRRMWTSESGGSRTSTITRKASSKSKNTTRFTLNWQEHHFNAEKSKNYNHISYKPCISKSRIEQSILSTKKCLN